MNVMNYQDYDVILNVFAAIENDKHEDAMQCLAGKFSSVVLKNTVSKNEYLEVYHRIKEGIPNAKFKILDLTTDGETFKANIKISGTHSNTIPSPKKGWKSLKPAGHKINKIVSSVEIVLHSNQIMEIRNLDENRGVIAGLLDELQLLPKNYSTKFLNWNADIYLTTFSGCRNYFHGTIVKFYTVSDTSHTHATAGFIGIKSNSIINNR